MRHHLALVLILATLLLSTATATWTTSATVPSAFRPLRTVSFQFIVSSNSGADLPVNWNVRLFTCHDVNANGFCETNEPYFIDHGIRPVNLLGGQSTTVSWSVNLDQPEATYRYYFSVACQSSPCTGEQPAFDDRTGTFQLRYTNTWTRTILATTPTQEGATQTVTYRLTSTSADDPDLSGTAELFSRPPGGAESSMGEKPYSVSAGLQVLVQWPGVVFPEIGTHRLRVTDTLAAESTLNVTVRGVHLHVHQPRSSYPAGSTFGLYITLEGHGADPDPQGVANTNVRLVVKNGSFVVHNTTLLTGADGRAYANVSTAHDHAHLEWNATASGSWLGIAYNLNQTGMVVLEDGAQAAVQENLTQLREDLEDVRFRGVHLNELATHNLFLSIVRGAGAVVAVASLILLVFAVATRV